MFAGADAMLSNLLSGVSSSVAPVPEDKPAKKEPLTSTVPPFMAKNKAMKSSGKCVSFNPDEDLPPQAPDSVVKALDVIKALEVETARMGQSGLSPELMASLQSSVQVINMLREENESLQAEKQDAEKLLKEVKSEVGRGMKQQRKFNAKAEREKFQAEKAAMADRMKAQAALLQEVEKGLEEARENARLKVEQDKLRAEKEAAEAKVRECRVLLESVQDQINDGMLDAKNQTKAERMKNLELNAKINRLEAEKFEAQEKASQCEGLLKEVYEGLKASGTHKKLLEEERALFQQQMAAAEEKAAIEAKELRRAKEAAEAKVEDFTEQLQGVRSELDEAKQAKKSTFFQSKEEKKKNAELKAQLESLAAEKKEAQEKVTHFEGHLATVYKELEEAKSKITTSSDQLAMLEELKLEQEKLQVEKEALEAKAALETAQLKRDKEKAQEQVNETTKLLKLVRTELDQRISEAQNQSAAGKQKNAELKAQIETLAAEKEVAQTKVAHCEGLLTDVYTGLEGARADVEATSAEKDRLIKEREQLLKEKKEAEAKAALETQLLREEKEQTELQASIAAARLLQEQDKLKSQRSAAQAKAFECERQLEIIRTEVSDGIRTLKSERKQTKQQNHLLKKQVVKLTKEKKEADDKARRCERKLADVLKTEIDNVLSEDDISLSSNQERKLLKELEKLRGEKSQAEKRAKKCEILLEEVFHNNEQKARIQLIEASRQRSFPLKKHDPYALTRAATYAGRETEDDIILGPPGHSKKNKQSKSKDNTVARAIASHKAEQLQRKASKQKEDKKKAAAAAAARIPEEDNDNVSIFDAISLPSVSLPSVDNMVPSLESLFRYV